MYERKTAQNKASLIRRLVNLKFKDGRNVAKHLSDFQGLVNQLTTMKMVLDDELQALLLLSSLPGSWDTLMVSLSNSAPQGVLTMIMVKDSMFNKEMRRKEQGILTGSEAIVTEKRGRGKDKKSHDHDKSRGKSKGRSKQRNDLKCYHCGKPCHMKRECRQLKKEQGNRNNNEKNEAKDITATASTGDEVIIAYDNNCVNLTSQDTCWIVDSGASFT